MPSTTKPRRRNESADGSSARSQRARDALVALRLEERRVDEEVMEERSALLATPRGLTGPIPCRRPCTEKADPTRKPAPAPRAPLSKGTDHAVAPTEPLIVRTRPLHVHPCATGASLGAELRVSR
jgi:hypothetical protein